MNDVNPPLLTSSLAFRLGTVGAVVTTRFTELVEGRGLKPKHLGLLATLSAGAASSQLELARVMGVAPSLVVSLADQLEGMGALQRVRDPADRRRQALVLTDAGRALLAECAALAHGLDDELTASLAPAEREALGRALGVLAREAGLPVE
ncbi:MarR family winged helix-turn-helix transcriptional regulator [Kitasatospora kazusensis]